MRVACIWSHPAKGCRHLPHSTLLPSGLYPFAGWTTYDNPFGFALFFPECAVFIDKIGFLKYKRQLQSAVVACAAPGKAHTLRLSRPFTRYLVFFQLSCCAAMRPALPVQMSRHALPCVSFAVLPAVTPHGTLLTTVVRSLNALPLRGSLVTLLTRCGFVAAFVMRAGAFRRAVTLVASLPLEWRSTLAPDARCPSFRIHALATPMSRCQRAVGDVSF